MRSNQQKQLEYIKQKYDASKKLAEEMWIEGDHEGTPNDFYYFQCGFVAGMNYEDQQRLGSSQKIGERMTAQTEIRERLLNIIKQEFVDEWLDTPNPAFKNKKPRDMILENNIDKINEMLYRLESGEIT